MLISKEQQDAHARITETEKAILLSMEEIGTSSTEVAIAMTNVMHGFLTESLRKQFPLPEEEKT